MTETRIDPKHFTKAVTELGEKQPVVTTQAVFNDHGIKVLDKGIQVNRGIYARLMTHNLSAPIEDALGSTQSVTGQRLREQAEQALQQVPFLARVSADSATQGLLLGALETIPLSKPMAFQLSLAREMQPDLFRHSIHMALVAAWLTLGPLVSRFDIGLAAAAGLLHDVGMLHLDPTLLTPGNDISPEQSRQLYSHPLVSVALLERHHEYPQELLRAVKEHHEFIDGSGYPSHLSGSAISPLGRILSLSELVTTMLAPRDAAGELRLSVLLRMNRHRYDSAMVERVLLHLKPQAELPVDVASLIADPANHLKLIDAALSACPTDLATLGGQNAPRREGMVTVLNQTTQLHRTLASVGVSPEQLTQLGADPLDDFLRAELGLLAHEATWQLRSLARQARRRWQLEPDDQYPQALQAWLGAMDQLVTRIPSAAPARHGVAS